MDEFDESPSGSRPKPSKTPSWIMLGFMLGALFVWALPRSRETVSARPPPRAETKVAPPAAPPRLSDVEAVFEEWKSHAVWANDTTYVCLWDSESKTFRDCFEIVRRGDELFFRSIVRPRNLSALGGVPPNSPLEFLNPVPVVRGLFGEPLAAPGGIGERMTRPAAPAPGK